jgi:hypothetical protein
MGTLGRKGFFLAFPKDFQRGSILSARFGGLAVNSPFFLLVYAGT